MEQLVIDEKNYMDAHIILTPYNKVVIDIIPKWKGWQFLKRCLKCDHQSISKDWNLQSFETNNHELKMFSADLVKPDVCRNCGNFGIRKIEKQFSL